MQRLLQWFRTPFPLDLGVARQFRLGAVYGLFVWLFLYGFRPFGLNEFQGNLLVYTLQSGLLTALFLPAANLLASRLFPRQFDEERWTSGRAIAWTLATVGLLGLANALHTAAFMHMRLNAMDLLRFEVYTLSIGLFPTGVSILIRQRLLAQAHATQSQAIAAMIPAPSSADHPRAETAAHPTELRLPNGKDEVSLPAADLAYIRAADNYIEVYQRTAGKVQRHLLRATLAEAEARLAAQPQWIRCHKSYLVNLAHVQHSSGNAQGCRLHFAEGLESVPVSRSRIEEVRSRLSA